MVKLDTDITELRVKGQHQDREVQEDMLEKSVTYGGGFLDGAVAAIDLQPVCCLLDGERDMTIVVKLIHHNT